MPPMSRPRKRIENPTRWTMGLRGFGQKKKGQAVALPWPLDHVDEKPEIHVTDRNVAKVSAFDLFHFFIAGPAPKRVSF